MSEMTLVVRDGTRATVVIPPPTRLTIDQGRGPQGPAGPQGLSGPQGESGPQGIPGVSTSIWEYKANVSITSGNPGAGYVVWNNADQDASTELLISHLTENDLDIEIFMALLRAGQKLIIQDADNSENAQTWLISGEPVHLATSEPHWWSIPVELISSAGTGASNFPGDHELFIALIRDGLDGAPGETGPQGPAGATGPQGNTGPTGPAGADGADGAPGADGATGPQGETGPIGLTGPAGADGTDGTDGAGVAVGGTTGQVLAKNSSTDYDTGWIDPSGVSAASETVAGIAEVATQTETDTGADDARIVTPLKLQTRLAGFAQPLDSDLTALAALSTTSYGRALLELANQAALMALLNASSETVQGIIELATQTETNTGTDDVRAVTPLKLQTRLAAFAQPLDSDLTSIAALSTTSYGRAFLELANQAALMALLSAASESLQGKIEIATQSETDTGTDDARAVTPLKLQTKSVLINAQTGTTYTFVLTDQNKWVSFNNASAITVTVPPNSSVAFPVGTQIEGVQLGAGQVTFAQGAGVTIRNVPGLKIAAQYGVYGLMKIATDEWVLYGRLSA